MKWVGTEYLGSLRPRAGVLLLWAVSFCAGNVSGAAPADGYANAGRIDGTQGEVDKTCSWSPIDLAIPVGIKVVQYEVRRERLCVSIRSSDFSVTTFESVDERRLEHLVSELLRGMSSGSPDSSLLGQELSKILLGPILDHLESGNRILFAPTGPLADVPFAALRIPGDGRFLIEEYSLAVLPDLRRFARSTREPRAVRYDTLVALADPRGVGVTGLPWAAHEALEAGRDYPFSVRLTGMMSSLRNLEKTLPHMDVLHIAAHTICESRSGEAAIPLLGEGKAGEEGLVLQQSQKACLVHEPFHLGGLATHEKSEDGRSPESVQRAGRGSRRPGCGLGKEPVVLLSGTGQESLTLAAIRSLDVSNLSMIVLSGCATAKKHLDCTALGMMEPFRLASGIRANSLGSRKSLAGAFLELGVPSVVGTLWPIEDSQAVASLMISFHRTVARCADPMLALRVAQLEAVYSDSTGLPSDWAAFQIVAGRQTSSRPVGQLEAKEGGGVLPLRWVVGGGRMPILSVTGCSGGRVSGVGGETSGSGESRAAISCGVAGKEIGMEAVEFRAGREVVTGVDFRRLHCSLLGLLIQNQELASSIESELGLGPGCLRVAECWDKLPHALHLLVTRAFVKDLRSALAEASK